MKNKKAQEEMVGFVLIVIMLIVMGIILLFLVRPRIEAKKDLQVENLLNSMLESTSAGKSIRDMVSNCAMGVGCAETTDELKARLDASLSSSGLVLGKTLNAYSFSVSKDATAFINISNGNFTGNSITALVALQNADVMLKFYY